ncbi:MAG: bifunctional oligoribonuclease/PAP phosphatase NrnA [Ignavibacteria bacterium]|nr:bifunctional oligoribonuclease/PAP phosphatase NrnA [Ignavibacteria bacterium]
MDVITRSKDNTKLLIIPDFETSAKNIINVLKKYNKFLILTHSNPDGDAIGSCLALYHYLKQKNKIVSFKLLTPIPTNLHFLNGIDKIEIINNPTNDEIPNDLDVIVILDLNDISRLKEIQAGIEKSSAIKIIVDHHQEPKNIADYYLIDTTASSTGEILYKLLKIDETIVWTPAIIDNLYVAIMTDTGNFRFERTDGEVHRIVADLIDYGVDPVKLYNEVYNKIPINAARLMGIGYSRLESYYDNKLVIMPIYHKDFIDTNTKEEDTEGFVESLLSIDGVLMSILMLEIVERNEIRVSIRSKGEYSARSLALHFGGGGHINAAGCRFHNSDFNQVKQKLIEKAKNILFQ